MREYANVYPAAVWLFQIFPALNVNVIRLDVCVCAYLISTIGLSQRYMPPPHSVCAFSTILTHLCEACDWNTPRIIEPIYEFL